MSTETKVPSRERVRELAEAHHRHFGITGMNADRDTAAALRYLEALLDAMPQVREALSGCEQNLRLIHEAAGPVPRSAPMPPHSTFAAWEAARAALAILDGLEARDG